MTTCVACGVAHPRARLAEPGAPSRVAMLDANAVALLLAEGTPRRGEKTTVDALLELVAKSPRFVRCARCGALSRTSGEGSESWVPGPDAPPPEGTRRVVRIESRRVMFEELWRGERTAEIIAQDLDVGAGDVVRIVEAQAPDQRDPTVAPRFVLGHVTYRGIVAGVAVVCFRVTERGHEDRALESRRQRLELALELNGSHVAGAASTLGISVGEAYRWVHELGFDDRIKRYRTRRKAS